MEVGGGDSSGWGCMSEWEGKQGWRRWGRDSSGCGVVGV